MGVMTIVKREEGRKASWPGKITAKTSIEKNVKRIDHP
jgi:hypothetical protein